MAKFNPTPYNIGGGIDFGFANPEKGTYKSAYQNALHINAKNYENVLAGYQGLTQSVLGNIQGMGESAITDVNDYYTRALGADKISNTSRGLGNTTVMNSTQRGLMEAQNKGVTGAKNQFAGTYAGYQSQLGQAQLNWMNSISAPYPNANNYANPYGGVRPTAATPLMGGGYGGGGISRGGGGGMIPQTPSGNYGGGAYGYVPPAAARPGGNTFGYEGGNDFADIPDDWWSDMGYGGDLPGYDYSGAQGGMPGFDVGGYGGGAMPATVGDFYDSYFGDF